MSVYAHDDGGLPKWFWANAALSMDPRKGPDEQYRAGARDMHALMAEQLQGAVEALREARDWIGAGHTGIARPLGLLERLDAALVNARGQ